VSARSTYMSWAKTRPEARFDLATSGVRPLALAELGAGPEDLELTGPDAYGWPPLRRALAAHLGVAEDAVVLAFGTTQANHLALAALAGPGDEVVVEHPVYEPLLALVEALGAEPRPFARRPEDGFAVDPREVARQVTPRTRAIILTNLHNPSGAPVEERALRHVGRIARDAGARVLVDEVYLETLRLQPGPPPPSARSAVHLGREFVTTGSLTKAYGLSGLRCGWVLAEPELARRMWDLYDLFVGTPVHAAERLSVVAMQRLPAIAARAHCIPSRNRALLDRFLDGRPDLEAVRPPGGTVVFPRWLRGDAGPLCDRLLDRYQTAVVPGRFFGAADHFRLGIGGDGEDLRQGLERLGAALDELAAPV
jgi:aspartate/methionine/tyrosine aminotransferase